MSTPSLPQAYLHDLSAALGAGKEASAALATGLRVDRAQSAFERAMAMRPVARSKQNQTPPDLQQP